MNCFPCFNKDKDDDDDDETEQPAAQRAPSKKETPAHHAPSTDVVATPMPSHVKTFNFRELAVATRNFRLEFMIGEGGFGRVFKGKLKSGETVAVKQLDRNGMQGNTEFQNEVAALSLLEHPNLLKCIGFCADGDQRLLVFEFMEMGSLEKHLFANNPDKKPMDWFTRMKIAAGTAQGLEYLHDTANPPIIFRDLKPTNILLDENYEPKLSSFRNAKLGPGGGNMHPTSRAMGTYGYSAPEYSSGGELTLKSDVYSFGVVLLELITGRRVIDTNRPNDEQNLVTWAQPIFRDPKRFPDLADPRLNKEFPVTGLNQAVGICAMCLQEESAVRPLVADLVAALSFLAMPQPIAPPTSEAFSPPPNQKMDYPNAAGHNPETQCGKNSSDRDKDEESSQNRNSEGENDDSSEGDSSYSDADSADLDEDDEEEEVNANNNNNNVNMLKPDKNYSRKRRVGSISSRNGSHRRSSSTNRVGSTRRKVTFKEPHLSSKRNGSKKMEGNEISSPEFRQKGSSFKSECSSESEDDEKRSSRRKNKNKHH